MSSPEGLQRFCIAGVIDATSCGCHAKVHTVISSVLP